jgi:hypothetical protein
MHSNLEILGTLSVLYVPDAGSGTYSTPLRGSIKFPPFPTAVKSMRGTHLRFDMSALIITGVSTGEER